MLSRKQWAILSAAVLGVGAIVSTAKPARAADDAKGVELFESKIRPILANNCVGCHGNNEGKKPKGGLRLDTKEMLLQGGLDDDKKPITVVVPGDPAKSLLIEVVKTDDEEKQMPPPKVDRETKKKTSRKLSAEQIEALTEWVKLGAPYGEKPVEKSK